METAGAHSPLSAAGLHASVEGSLRRLQVDTIDIFYLHQPDHQADLDETLTEIAALQAEGKIGALGVSNYAAWQVMDVIAAAQRAGASRPVVGQNVFNLLARRIEDEWAEFAATHQILTMCYNPLAGGMLARRPDPQTAPSRFATSSL
ncbi:MAG: aldo/keto reductase, partial [Beutenbergiaceae bacterium]